MLNVTWPAPSLSKHVCTMCLDGEALGPQCLGREPGFNISLSPEHPMVDSVHYKRRFISLLILR